MSELISWGYCRGIFSSEQYHHYSIVIPSSYVSIQSLPSLEYLEIKDRGEKMVIYIR
jgi:hypothetical protein